MGTGASNAERSALWLDRLALAATGTGAWLSALYRIRTHDTFFHLATGRAIAELGAVPRVDIFSFTARGLPWSNHSAGFQWLLYHIYQAVGFVGLSLWQALVALALWVLGIASVQPEQRAYGCAIALTPFVFYREVLEARPHALGFACLALALTLAHRAPRAPSRGEAIVWILNYAVFCGVHGSHLLVLLVCGLAAAFALVRRDLVALRSWALLLAACVSIALVLQPEALGQGSQHLSSEFLEGNVAEWRPLTALDLTTSGKGVVFLGCLAFSLMGGVAAVRLPNGATPVSAFSLSLLAVFMLFALSSRRMMALFLFAVAPLWVPLASHALALLTRDLRSIWRRALGAVALVALLSVLFRPDEPYLMGVGLEEARFPIGAVERLRRADAPQRVYNAYNFGAYLMWTRTPVAGVFVDGRAITVYPAEFLASFERAYHDMRSFELLCARFSVDGVLMPRGSPRVQRLLRYLSASPRWIELYRDELSVLYVARAPR